MTLMSVWESLRTPVAFLFVLGVLVFVHEFGHFLVARWHGVRVITFSLGFGPKLLRFRRGDTEYCVSAIPLGGYVKLAGETVEEDRTGAPDEFLSKSKFVRFQVYLAGPIMNLVLAWIVLAGVLYQGAEVPIADSSPAVVGAIEKGGSGDRAGLQLGDRILAVNGRAVPNWEELNVEVLPKGNQQVNLFVERAGQRMTVKATPAAIGRYEIGSLGIGPVLRPQVAGITHPGGPGDRAGVRVDDVILTVDGERLDQPAVLDRIKDSPGKTLTLAVERQGQPVELKVTPSSEGLKGAGFVGLRILPYEFRRIEPTVVQAFTLSAEQNWANTKLIGRTLKGLFARETPVKQLMGPIAIGSMAGSAAQIGWLAIFQLMAMLSLNLGLLNLMPVPVLDGGHIAILGVEGLARRDLSVRVKERILMVGAALIVLLMVTVIYNDIVRLFK
jgi:regulator of sigma E protease